MLAFRDAATASAVPLEVVEAAYEGEAARYGARLVLLRPDNFVAWTSDSADPSGEEIREALEQATGAAIGH